MCASRHYITPDSSPRTRLNGFEKGDKSKTGFWIRGNRDLRVLRHAPGAGVGAETGAGVGSVAGAVGGSGAAAGVGSGAGPVSDQ
jgi:hypothetical protein